jgi:HAD superfamily hydrolase (TIGR01509 family)
VTKIFSTPRAVVFDFDGLIARTEPCWHAAYERVLSGRGRRLGPAETSRLLGASVRGASRILEVPEDELRNELRAAFDRAQLHLLPGIGFVLERLRATFPMAVATNGPRDVVAAALERLGVSDSFDAVLSAEALTRDKPAPDVYLAACKALGVDPSQAIALEDSVLGATSARAAGLVVIQVAEPNVPPADADMRIRRLDDPAFMARVGLSAAPDLTRRRLPSRRPRPTLVPGA